MPIINPKTIYTIAKKEFMDNIRSKWIILISIINWSFYMRDPRPNFTPIRRSFTGTGIRMKAGFIFEN